MGQIIAAGFDVKVRNIPKGVVVGAFCAFQRCVDRLVGVRNGAVTTFGFSHFSAVLNRKAFPSGDPMVGRYMAVGVHRSSTTERIFRIVCQNQMPIVLTVDF